jgi:hypothetical protein
MTINDFNSKINLPALIRDGVINGPKDGEFIKVPRFGWFVKNPNDNVVKNLTTILGGTDLDKKLKDLIKDKTSYHEARIIYSETAFNKLENHIRMYNAACLLNVMAVHEAESNSSIYHNGKYLPIKDKLTELGHGSLITNGIGLVTPSMFKEFLTLHKRLKLSESIKNKLIFTSFCAPTYPASIEYATIDNLEQFHTLVEFGEKGWYGNIEGNKILASPSRMMYEVGMTWDKKLNYWLNKQVETDTTMTLRQCLELWKEARPKNFSDGNSPLDIIEKRGEVKILKENLNGLTFDQIDALQKRFGEDFVTLWREREEDEIRLGHFTFRMTPNGITIYYKGVSDEFTNFSFIIEKYIKRDQKVYRVGTIGHRGQFVQFELDNDVFRSVRSLMRAITTIFFDNRIGIPIILTQYQYMLIDVINRFSRNAKFDQDIS